MQDEDFHDIVMGLFLSPEKKFDETTFKEIRFVTNVLIPEVHTFIRVKIRPSLNRHKIL